MATAAAGAHAEGNEASFGADQQQQQQQQRQEEEAEPEAMAASDAEQQQEDEEEEEEEDVGVEGLLLVSARTALWGRCERVAPGHACLLACLLSEVLKGFGPCLDVTHPSPVAAAVAAAAAVPLNGTYFQVNEVFADHETIQAPIKVRRGGAPCRAGEGRHAHARPNCWLCLPT